MMSDEGNSMEKLKRFLSRIPRPLRWILVTVIGTVLIILGVIMLVTPGPGILFLFLGISVLALEIEWARELHKKGLQGLEQLVANVRARFPKKRK